MRKLNDRSVHARLISLFIAITSTAFTSTLGAETGFPERLDIEGLKMIRVNPGTFTMGAPNMPPRAEPFEGLRTVEMDKVFYLGEVEVSQAFWSRHMKINPSRFQTGRIENHFFLWR
ncbi:MAG: hypothetical protein EBS13_08485 [Verrucomicrobia bacterium]|nr:hypothetical protein [Verrucomicrobiota bacterium]